MSGGSTRAGMHAEYLPIPTHERPTLTRCYVEKRYMEIAVDPKQQQRTQALQIRTAADSSPDLAVFCRRSSTRRDVLMFKCNLMNDQICVSDFDLRSHRRLNQLLDQN